MNVQRMVWFVDRFMIYAVLLILAVVLIFALVYEQGLITIVALVLFIFALQKGLVRLKIHPHSVVVRDGKVVFFVPETTVRNRFDFVSRGQSIVQLPEYQLLDRTFDIDVFFPGRERTVSSCRLLLCLGYLMQPVAWQRAYDSFVKHGERLPLEVKKLLVMSSTEVELQPVSITSDEAMREYLTPVVSQINRALESVGLEVVDVQCSFSEGPIMARLVADDQQETEQGVGGALFTWVVREEDAPQKGRPELLEVPRDVGQQA